MNFRNFYKHFSNVGREIVSRCISKRSLLKRTYVFSLNFLIDIRPRTNQNWSSKTHIVSEKIEPPTHWNNSQQFVCTSKGLTWTSFYVIYGPFEYSTALSKERYFNAFNKPFIYQWSTTYKRTFHCKERVQIDAISFLSKIFLPSIWYPFSLKTMILQKLSCSSLWPRFCYQSYFSHLRLLRFCSNS